MEYSKTLFCVSEFSGARGRISSKSIDNLGTRPQKDSPDLPYGKNINWKYLSVTVRLIIFLGIVYRVGVCSPKVQKATYIRHQV